MFMNHVEDDLMKRLHMIQFKNDKILSFGI